MEYLKKGFRKIFGVSIILSIILLILGIFLLFSPEGTITLISTIVGTMIMLYGIQYLTKYFKSKQVNYRIDLILGSVCLIIALILILKPELVASILPFLLGIFFVINSVPKIQYAFEMKKNNAKAWIKVLVMAIITLLCGVLFIVNPFGGAVALTQVIGLFTIIYAIIDLINYFILGKNIKYFKKGIKKVIDKDSRIIDVTDDE